MAAKTSSVASRRRRATWGNRRPQGPGARRHSRPQGPQAVPPAARLRRPPAPLRSPTARRRNSPQNAAVSAAPPSNPGPPGPLSPAPPPGEHGRSGHHPPVLPPRHRLPSAPRGGILPARDRFRKRSVGSSRAAQRRETALVRRPAIPGAWTSASTFRVLPPCPAASGTTASKARSARRGSRRRGTSRPRRSVGIGCALGHTCVQRREQSPVRSGRRVVKRSGRWAPITALAAQAMRGGAGWRRPSRRAASPGSSGHVRRSARSAGLRSAVSGLLSSGSRPPRRGAAVVKACQPWPLGAREVYTTIRDSSPCGIPGGASGGNRPSPPG